jgi:tetratricopeptide (TPR) repeat protein
LAAGMACAQNVKVQTAFSNYKYEKYDKAAEAIDEAIQHEQTSQKDKTWYYRGLIYHAMHDDSTLSARYPDHLKIAYESYARALELDPDSKFKEEIEKRMPIVLNQMFQVGVEHYNRKEFEPALKAFESVLSFNAMDTLSMVNAAFSADRAGETTKAKTYFTKLVALQYSDPNVYRLLSKIHMTEGDSAKALEVIQAGRKVLPQDTNLLLDEINYYLASGRHNEALPRLNEAISKDTTNHILFFARGNLYDKSGQTEKAQTDYEKAISLKPDYFDAYYNLGAMYFNQGADMANKANNIPASEQKRYDAAKKAADDKFRQAMPYLEKALELSPDDRSTLLSLKQLYARIGETLKYEQVKAKLEQ